MGQSSRASTYRLPRNTITGTRKGSRGGWGKVIVSTVIFHWSAACEHQPNGQHQYRFHLRYPLIMAASLTARQSKTDF